MKTLKKNVKVSVEKIRKYKNFVVSLPDCDFKLKVWNPINNIKKITNNYFSSHSN